MSRLSVVICGVTVLSVAAVVGMAYYFDKKRKRDPNLRKKILKERKVAAVADNQAKISKKNSEEGQPDREQSIVTSSDKLLNIPLESVFKLSVEDREQHFVMLLTIGEELLDYGEKHLGKAVDLFFRAMKLLPNPTELIVNLQKVLPEKVFTALIKRITDEGSQKILEYFETLPPKNAHVKVLPSELVNSKGEKEQSWCLVATKDFDCGEEIYSEVPDVSSVINMDSMDDYCELCQSKLSESRTACRDCNVFYCSMDCLNKALGSYHPFLCVPKKGKASEEPHFMKLRDYCRNKKSFYVAFVAKYLAYLSFEETNSLSADRFDSAFMHFEFLRPMLLPMTSVIKEEAALLRQIFASCESGIGEFLTDERYLSVKGALVYNAIGILGNDIAVDESFSMELQNQADSCANTESEVVRHNEPFAALKGLGLYHLSCHLGHSCDPCCDLKNTEHNHTLSVVARRPIKEGEKLTISYVPVAKVYAASSRKALLQDKFFINCTCNRCVAS